MRDVFWMAGEETSAFEGDPRRQLRVSQPQQPPPAAAGLVTTQSEQREPAKPEDSATEHRTGKKQCEVQQHLERRVQSFGRAPSEELVTEESPHWRAA